MEVELDAFSGRPNPRWEVPISKASEIETKLRSLPAAAGTRPELGLGYRGFMIRQGSTTFRVYKGLVIAEEGGTARLFRDVDHLEADLAADARERGYGAAVASIP